MLPVPLNSSKITSSMREPVSMSAVAMIVSEPPSSMLRAAPKKRFGFCSAFESRPPDSILPGRRNHGVVGARQARDRIEQDEHVLLVLDQPLGLLDDHLGDLHVALRRLVEGRGDHLAVDRALHVGHLFGPLVDEQHDQVDLGMVRRHRLRDALQQHRLAGARRRDDQAALALADRRHQVHHARRRGSRPRSRASAAPAGRAASGSRRTACRAPGRAPRS